MTGDKSVSSAGKSRLRLFPKAVASCSAEVCISTYIWHRLSLLCGCVVCLTHLGLLLSIQFCRMHPAFIALYSWNWGGNGNAFCRCIQLWKQIFGFSSYQTPCNLVLNICRKSAGWLCYLENSLLPTVYCSLTVPQYHTVNLFVYC